MKCFLLDGRDAAVTWDFDVLGVQGLCSKDALAILNDVPAHVWELGRVGAFLAGF